MFSILYLSKTFLFRVFMLVKHSHSFIRIIHGLEQLPIVQNNRLICNILMYSIYNNGRVQNII